STIAAGSSPTLDRALAIRIGLVMVAAQRSPASLATASSCSWARDRELELVAKQLPAKEGLVGREPGLALAKADRVPVAREEQLGAVDLLRRDPRTAGARAWGEGRGDLWKRT